MPLSELLPTVTQLSHQDKLRLINFLLVEVAKEEGCDLQTATETMDREKFLIEQLASTDAVVWSPYDSYEAAQTLSELLLEERQKSDD